MEAGKFTEYIRNRTLYEYYLNNPDAPDNGHNEQRTLFRKLGAQALYNQHKLIAACCPCVSDSYTYPDAVLIALEAFMYYGASQNWGPTRCSRFNYLWFHTIVSGYNWVQQTSKIAGIRDNWNWSIHYPLSSDGQFIWMNNLLVSMMPTFIPGYDTSLLEENERTRLNITREQQLQIRANIKESGHWSAWFDAWRAWWTSREMDGHAQAMVAPTDAELPNAEKVLDPAQDIDPITWPQPRKWTPLLINGVKKNYLTYRWNDVRSSCLSASDEASVAAIGASSFPTDLARDSEISEVMLLTGSLTDTQKVSAEFWAGGPNTASPPGMLMWFWKEFMIVRNIPHSCNFDSFFYSGFDLAQHIFETSRVVWGLKKNYMQARPIQEIRRMYRLEDLPNYDGTTIRGTFWVPYQESNFISPPFADFPSGHSAYSQTFASVMTDWFGARIPLTQPRELNDLVLLSNTFTRPESFVYGQFIIRAGKSAIQPNVVPAQDIELRWTTWQEIANSAGISRKYGGIHATSAHVGGQAVANMLHVLLRAKSGLTL